MENEERMGGKEGEMEVEERKQKVLRHTTCTHALMIF